MDASRKATREGNETTLQYQSRQDALLTEELNEERLRQLLVFVVDSRKRLSESLTFNVESNTSASVRALKGKHRASSIRGCGTGWTGTCRQRNRLFMLRGRLPISSKPHDSCPWVAVRVLVPISFS